MSVRIFLQLSGIGLRIFVATPLTEQKTCYTITMSVILLTTLPGTLESIKAIDSLTQTNMHASI